MSVMMDSPDAHIPRSNADAFMWAPLFRYAMSLHAVLPPAFYPPSILELDNAHIEGLQLLEALRLGVPSMILSADEHHKEHVLARRAVHLAKTVYERLPMSLDTKAGVISMFGQAGEEALKNDDTGTDVQVCVCCAYCGLPSMMSPVARLVHRSMYDGIRGKLHLECTYDNSLMYKSVRVPV